MPRTKIQKGDSFSALWKRQDMAWANPGIKRQVFGLWGIIPQVFYKRRDVGSADLETGDHPCLSMCLSLLSDDIYLHIGKLKREKGFSIGHWPLIKVLKRY